MNKKKICIITALCLVAILLFPIPVKASYSGDGAVYAEDGMEKIGECILSVEVTSLESVLHCYKKSFTFTLNGTKWEEFESNHHSETDDGMYQITQGYYDRIMDQINFCSLFYSPQNASLKLSLKGSIYVLPVSES